MQFFVDNLLFLPLSCSSRSAVTHDHTVKLNFSRAAGWLKPTEFYIWPGSKSRGAAVDLRCVIVVCRLTLLIDSVLNFIVPSWNTDSGSATLVQNVKHLLPLSTKRMTLLDSLIKDSESRYIF